MRGRERLMRAMIDSPDLEAAYMYSPEFKAQVTVIADMLPIILKGLAEEAYRGHQRRTQAYEHLAYNPGPAAFTVEKEVHTGQGDTPTLDALVEHMKPKQDDPRPKGLVEPGRKQGGVF